jgi:hypothetical protein
VRSGRRSHLPAIRSLCIVYVELIRGVPLISVLFMASFMFPLFMPQGTQVDVLLRVFVGITLFAPRIWPKSFAAACRRFRRAGRGRGVARTFVLADAAQDRAAAGAEARRALDHEQLHQHVQGHRRW